MRHALISIGVLGALMLPATPTVAQTREGKKLQLEQFFDIESVSNPRISPDGTQIVYTRGLGGQGQRPAQLGALDHERRRHEEPRS